jgi:hypothetical protein
MDPAAAGQGFKDLAQFGASLGTYGDARNAALEKALNLNDAVERGAAYRQGFAKLYSEYQQTVDGKNMPDEELKRFTERAKELRAQMPEPKNPAQKLADAKYYEETMSVYTPKIMDTAHIAGGKRTDILMREELGTFQAETYAALARQDENFLEIATGNAEMVKRAVLARVGIGPDKGLSLLDADAKMEKALRDYWGGLVHTTIGNPETFRNTQEAWNDNRIIYEGKSLRQLVDPATVPAVEGFLQKTFEVTTNREEAFYRRMESQQDRAENRARIAEEKRYRELQGAYAKDKEAQAIVKSTVTNPEDRARVEKRIVETHVALGGSKSVMDVTLDTLDPKRQPDQPRDALGTDVNNTKEMDRYGQTLIRRGRTVRTAAEFEQLRKDTEWYRRNRGAIPGGTTQIYPVAPK